jgi:hypothetical protein
VEHIQIPESVYPQLYVSKSSMHVEVAHAKHLVTLAGIVLLKDIGEFTATGPVDEATRPYYKGLPSGAVRQDVLHLAPNLPADLVPQGQWFVIEHCAPLVTINAIFNEHTAVNAAWAVDTCLLEATLGVTKFGGHNLGVPLAANIGVQDKDGILYRVGYTVTLSGMLTSEGPVGPG